MRRRQRMPAERGAGPNVSLRPALRLSRPPRLGSLRLRLQRLPQRVLPTPRVVSDETAAHYRV